MSRQDDLLARASNAIEDYLVSYLDDPSDEVAISEVNAELDVLLEDMTIAAMVVASDGYPEQEIENV